MPQNPTNQPTNQPVLIFYRNFIKFNENGLIGLKKNFQEFCSKKTTKIQFKSNNYSNDIL